MDGGYSVDDLTRAVEAISRAMLIRAPLLSRRLRLRPVAVIELEIARATVPAFRAEDV